MSDSPVTLQQLIDNGEYSRAISFLEEAVKRDPDNPELALTLASLRARAGDIHRAISELEALASNTDFVPAWVNLGQLQRVAGDLAQAKKALHKAAELAPSEPVVLKPLAELEQQLGHIFEAQELWRRLYRIQPDNFAARNGLLLTLMHTSPAEAVNHGEWCLRQQPNEVKLVMALAEANRNASRPEIALELFSRLKDNPDVRPQYILGSLLCNIELGYHDVALSMLDDLDKAQQGLTLQQLLLKARVLNELGHTDQAFLLSEKLATENPQSPEAQYGFMNMAPERVSDEMLRCAEELAPTLSGDALGRVSFGLAACYEKQNRLDDQFKWLDKGNKAMSEVRYFDQASYEFRHQTVKKVCTREWVDRFTTQTSLQRMCRPILVCGMPRSGTTLTEQMLGTLPEVFPTGESRTFNYGLQELIRLGGDSHFERVLNALDSSKVSAFAGAAWQALREHDKSQSDVFTNKSMDTPLYLGLIVAAFPDTRIIHVRRHPLDLGFGCYKQLFTHGQAFSFDWENIAYATSMFEKLMDHWAEIFPEKIMILGYEDLVTDPEASSRALAAHCGLDWSEEMLNFSDAGKAVRTASVNQVRQGLFTHAANRWERLGHRLDPLKAALDRYNVDYRSYPQ